MQALELITRSLRLINTPGRGATLSPDDQADAFTALQEIMDSKAVSKLAVPGISRHFFSLPSSQAIYSYGTGSGHDFRSDDFGSLVGGLGDPAPIKIEDAYIKQGAAIINNELIDEHRFEATGTWSLDADPDVDIVNNQYKVESPAAATSTTQALSGITAGLEYTLRVKLTIQTGDIDIQLRDSSTAFETFTLDGSGYFDFDFTWGTVIAPDINLVTDLTTDDILIDSISLMLRTKTTRLELPDGTGSDYPIRIIDQKSYNRRFSKGVGGRPDSLLYSRGPGGIGELRTDNASIAGEILVLDVLVNRLKLAVVTDEIRLNDDGILWLRYALADHVAGEYGKALTNRQIKIMDGAWDNLAAGNRRVNRLRVDQGLLGGRRRFSINRGDP